MEIGKRIAALRETKGWTTNRLANQCGLSQSFLRSVELGEKGISVESLSLLCDALGVSLKQFFDQPSGQDTEREALLRQVDRLTPIQRQALEDATRGTGLAEDVLGFWDELAEEQSPEAALAHDADQLDLICNLHVELGKGNAFAEEWLDSALKRLRTPLARELAEAILRTDPNRWWYGQVEKDWWIHHQDPAQS